MQKRSKWEQNIKSRLENHKTQVPDFIWDDIESELPKENLFRRNKSLIMNIAATAAIAVILATVYFTTVSKPVEDDRIAAVVNNTATIEKVNEQQSITEDISDNPVNQTQTGQAKKEILLAKNINQTAKGEIIYNRNADSEESALSENQKNLSEKNDVNINNEVNEREETETRDYSPLKKKKATSSYSSDNYYSTKRSNKANSQKGKWSVSVQAGNTYNSTSTAATGFSAREANILLQTNQISTYESMFVKTNIEQPETYTKHHFPITGAITVKRYLTDRISLETGLQYTMLRTDITSGGNLRLVKKQKFQYLGVPVKVNYDIVNSKGFVLYASAGGSIEGCISAKSYNELIRGEELTKKETESINMKKTQFSVNAAFGVQFNPISFMGIFAEPGVTYFFNDGNTNISNIRQEHPLNFQLRAGLRFNL